MPLRLFALVLASHAISNKFDFHRVNWALKMKKWSNCGSFYDQEALVGLLANCTLLGRYCEEIGREVADRMLAKLITKKYFARRG